MAASSFLKTRTTCPVTFGGSFITIPLLATPPIKLGPAPKQHSEGEHNRHVIGVRVAHGQLGCVLRVYFVVVGVLMVVERGWGGVSQLLMKPRPQSRCFLFGGRAKTRGFSSTFSSSSVHQGRCSARRRHKSNVVTTESKQVCQ